MRDRLRLAALGLVLTLALGGCQAGFWKEAGDTAGKGSFVSALATLGAVYGGPIGAFGGACLGYFFIGNIEADLKLAEVQQNLWNIAGLQDAVREASINATKPLVDQAQSDLASWLIRAALIWAAYEIVSKVLLARTVKKVANGSGNPPKP